MTVRDICPAWYFLVRWELDSFGFEHGIEVASMVVVFPQSLHVFLCTHLISFAT